MVCRGRGVWGIDRFSVVPEVCRLLVLWRGGVAGVHCELIARAVRGEGDPLPLLVVLCRVMGRDLMPGERAGFAAGPDAVRVCEVFLARLWGWCSQVWGLDHMWVPVLVVVGGRARRCCG